MSDHVEGSGITRNFEVVHYAAHFVKPEFIISRFDCASDGQNLVKFGFGRVEHVSSF